MKFSESPSFQVLPSLRRLKQRIIAASRGQYDAVFMSGSGSTIVGIGSPDPPQFIYDDEGYKDVFLSDLLPGWRQAMEKYDKQALEVGRAVARIIALALDLDANFFDKPEILGKPISLLRLLHYEGYQTPTAIFPRRNRRGQGLVGGLFSKCIVFLARNVVRTLILQTKPMFGWLLNL